MKWNIVRQRRTSTRERSRLVICQPWSVAFVLYLIPAFFRPDFRPLISSDSEDRGKEIACRPKPM